VSARRRGSVYFGLPGVGPRQGEEEQDGSGREGLLSDGPPSFPK